jgi:hypothetical protein
VSTTTGPRSDGLTGLSGGQVPHRPDPVTALDDAPAPLSQIIALVSGKRMNREQFFRVMSGLDEDRLRKTLWNLYWRGTASVRERIEVELASDGRGRPPRPAKPPADPETVQFEVDDFVSLARSGAYMGGDRRVSPRERSRWRSPSSGLLRKPRMHCVTRMPGLRCPRWSN